MILAAQNGNLPAHNMRITRKLTLPESVTKQHGWMRAQVCSVGRGESSAQKRMHTERLEEVVRNHIGQQQDAGSVLALHQIAPAAKSDDGFQPRGPGRNRLIFGKSEIGVDAL